MPELPEVETIKRQIRNELVGDVVVRVGVLDEMCFVPGEGSIEGEEIADVTRVGKYLFLHFASGRGLEIHLKMTGRLVVGERRKTKRGELDYARAPHTRVEMELKSGRKIYYWDTRKFGYLRVVEDVRDAVLALRGRMGPEPWDISVEEFLRKLKKTNRRIKDVILDQSIISGVGNIYANDALWRARIIPTKRASEIGEREAQKLLSAIREVLTRGFATGGASDNTYRDFYGKKGTYQNEFLVYGGGDCGRCGKRLHYAKVGGRGTWWCEKCQE